MTDLTIEIVLLAAICGGALWVLHLMALPRRARWAAALVILLYAGFWAFRFRLLWERGVPV